MKINICVFKDLPMRATDRKSDSVETDSGCWFEHEQKNVNLSLYSRYEGRVWING